ncbi:hypothetical protein SLE2022_344360 [Rubroshorea leprosula]
MDPKTPLYKHKKKRLTQDQVKLLERSFIPNKKLEPELKLRLASQLGVPPRQVAIWYQNKRARWKTQSLELDYTTLQVKLENAVAEKKRLERHVKHLQEELRRAQEMLYALNSNRREDNINGKNNDYNNYYNKNTLVSCTAITATAEEGGRSGLHEVEEVLQLDDELYASLIAGGNRSN